MSTSSARRSPAGVAVPTAVIDHGAVVARAGVQPRLAAKEAGREVLEAHATFTESQRAVHAREWRHVGQHEIVVLELQGTGHADGARTGERDVELQVDLARSLHLRTSSDVPDHSGHRARVHVVQDRRTARRRPDRAPRARRCASDRGCARWRPRCERRRSCRAARETSFPAARTRVHRRCRGATATVCRECALRSGLSPERRPVRRCACGPRP